MGYFKDIVDTATQKVVDFKHRFILNEHHTDVTRKMKPAGKFPQFLLLTTPKVNTDFFLADVAEGLEVSYNSQADKWRAFRSLSLREKPWTPSFVGKQR